MRVIIVLALLACVAVSLVSAGGSIGCLDESGQPVDWFFAMKGPQVKKSSDPRIAAGLMYQYLDANTIKKSSAFAVSPNKLDDPASALARTVQQTYDNVASQATSRDTGFVFYNDEVPNGKTCSAEEAHSKGVVHIDAPSQSGYWVIHSMPNVALPPATTKAPKFDIPDSAVIYGQSILCMSLDLTNLNAVLKQFQYHNPNVYAQAFPSALNASMKDAVAFFAGTRVKTAGAPGLSVVDITTRGGQKFTHFGKSRQWGMDLYRDAISPKFNVPLAVETWMRPMEPSYGPPSAKQYIVNVQSTSMVKVGGASPLTWTEEEDHSKWAISLSGAPIVCFGDINKQPSQWGRGGGSACINDARVHQALASVIDMVDTYKPAGAIPSGGQRPPSTAEATSGKKAPAPAAAAATPAKSTPAKTTTKTSTAAAAASASASTTKTTKKTTTKTTVTTKTKTTTAAAAAKTTTKTTTAAAAKTTTAAKKPAAAKPKTTKKTTAKARLLQLTKRVIE